MLHVISVIIYLPQALHGTAIGLPTSLGGGARGVNGAAYMAVPWSVWVQYWNSHISLQDGDARTARMELPCPLIACWSPSTCRMVCMSDMPMTKIWERLSGHVQGF